MTINCYSRNFNRIRRSLRQHSLLFREYLRITNKSNWYGLVHVSLISISISIHFCFVSKPEKLHKSVFENFNHKPKLSNPIGMQMSSDVLGCGLTHDPSTYENNSEKENEIVSMACACTFLWHFVCKRHIRFAFVHVHSIFVSLGISNVTILTKARVHICIKSYIPMAKWKMYDTNMQPAAGSKKKKKKHEECPPRTVCGASMHKHRGLASWSLAFFIRTANNPRVALCITCAHPNAEIPFCRTSKWLRRPCHGIIVVEWHAEKNWKIHFECNFECPLFALALSSVLSTQLCIERMVDASGPMSPASCMNCRLVVCTHTNCGLLLSLSCEYPCLIRTTHIPRKPSIFTSDACFKRFAGPRHFPCRIAETLFSIYLFRKSVCFVVFESPTYTFFVRFRKVHAFAGSACNKLPSSLLYMWWWRTPNGEFSFLFYSRYGNSYIRDPSGPGHTRTFFSRIRSPTLSRQ